MLLQLYVLYYGLAPVVALDAFTAAVLGLGLNYAAYEAELYRAGLEAVPVEQTEAALALGMSRGLALRRIVLPQAVRVALPGIANDFIALLKDSSLVSVITVVELTKQMTITAVDVRGWLVPGLLCAALYLAMSLPLSRLARRLERRLVRWRDDGDRGARPAGATRPGPRCCAAIDLAVTRGEVVAVIGPSGSGKTTFLRALNYLTPFVAGEVRVAGMRLRAGDARAARRPDAAGGAARASGWCSKDFDLFPHLTVLENVVEAPRRVLGRSVTDALRGWPALLARVGLAEHARGHIRTSSRAASSSASRSRARLRWSPRCCCSTSRPRRSIPRSWARCLR